MPVDQVERATQLVVSEGFLGVVGGLVIILLGAFFGIVLWVMRQRASDDAAERRAEREQQRAEREAELAERSRMFTKLLGDGNGNTGAVGELMGVVTSLSTQVRELVEAVGQINARLADGDEHLSRLTATVEELHCVREKRAAEGQPVCPVEGAGQ